MVDTEGREEYLKKRISTVEWDISVMRDEELRKRKQEQLLGLRSELAGLSRKAG